MPRKPTNANPFDAPPPADVEMEQQVLGSLILNPAAIDDVGVVSADFYDDAHRLIFGTMQDLRRKGTPADLPLLVAALKQHTVQGKNGFEFVGGAPFLEGVFQSVANAAHVRHYADVVREQSVKRRLRYLGEQIIVDERNGKPSADTIHKINSFLPSSLSLEREEGRNEFPEPIFTRNLKKMQQVQWVINGYIELGYKTFLVGMWKAGKTTYLIHEASVSCRNPSAQNPDRNSRWLFLTEEPMDLWAERRDLYGIPPDDVAFLINPFKTRPSYPQWHDFLAGIAVWFEAGDFDVFVIDPWAKFNPCPDENDNAKMMDAIIPLDCITAAGGAVVIVHHPRKGSDITAGQLSRGGGALPGAVDVIMELKRFDANRMTDTRRIITGLSRFSQTPQEVVLDLREDGYHNLGSRADASRLTRMETVNGILTDNPMTVEEVKDVWPKDNSASPRIIRDVLETGVTEERWDRVGVGKRGDPYRYMRIQA